MTSPRSPRSLRDDVSLPRRGMPRADAARCLRQAAADLRWAAGKLREARDYAELSYDAELGYGPGAAEAVLAAQWTFARKLEDLLQTAERGAAAGAWRPMLSAPAAGSALRTWKGAPGDLLARSAVVACSKSALSWADRVLSAVAE